MCGCKCLRKEEMGGGAAKRVGEWGGCTKNGGVRGRVARVMGVSGPKQDLRPNTPTRRLLTPMQAPNQRNSTALLVNVFPQIPNSQKQPPKERKKTKKNTLQLLFFANRVSQVSLWRPRASCRSRSTKYPTWKPRDEPFGHGSVAGTTDTAPSVVRPRPELLPAGPTNLLGWSDCFGRRKPLSSGNRILSSWVGWPRPHRLERTARNPWLSSVSSSDSKPPRVALLSTACRTY
jgi:hypothetical protein